LGIKKKKEAGCTHKKNGVLGIKQIKEASCAQEFGKN
jgi:hypothetical protein